METFSQLYTEEIVVIPGSGLRQDMITSPLLSSSTDKY